MSRKPEIIPAAIEQLLTVKDVALILKCSEDKVRRLVDLRTRITVREMEAKEIVMRVRGDRPKVSA